MPTKIIKREVKTKQQRERREEKFWRRDRSKRKYKDKTIEQRSTNKDGSGCCKGSGVGEAGIPQPTMSLGVRGIPTHLEIRLIMIRSYVHIEREKEKERERERERERRMDRPTDRPTDRQKDRQTERQTDRQTVSRTVRRYTQSQKERKGEKRG